MAKALEIKVKESLKELKQLQKRYPKRHTHIQLIILLQQGSLKTKDELASALSVSNRSVQTWRTLYRTKGITSLLSEHRGGHKVAQITPEIALRLETRLSNPKEGFRGYIEVQEWLKNTFGVKMEYSAVHKYLKRKYQTKLKVARKSHIDKDPAAEAVFKKPC